jgi:hypothetical protein
VLSDTPAAMAAAAAAPAASHQILRSFIHTFIIPTSFVRGF